MQYRQRLYSSYVSNNKKNIVKPDSNIESMRKEYSCNFLSVIKNWLKNVSKIEPILDVGCGDGWALKMFQQEGFSDLHGVDISEEQTDIAHRFFPQVIHGDAIEFLENNPEKFILITAFDVLEHLTKDEAFVFLDGILSSLKPGGRLILSLPNGDAPFAGGIIYGDLTHEVTYTASSLRHLLSACGFNEVQFKEFGPQATSWKGAIRFILWQPIRQLIRFINIVEAGGPSTGIYTRVMAATAIKL